MDFGHWLSSAAGRRPERVAIVAGDEQVTYRELLLRAVRAAGGLHLRGARRGEPVALILPPGLPFLEALHGCLILGTPAVPIDPRLAERERKAVLREIEVRVERSMTGDTGVFQLPDPGEREDVALVVHTSGTTGRPQPVTITYGNIRANARGLAQAMGLGDDERWLCPLPLAHVGGLMVFMRSAIMATTAVLAAPPFDAEAVARTLRDDDITIVSLVPAQLQKLLDAGATPGPRLRRVLLGGGAVPPVLLERARAAGFPVCPSYGLTQACSTVTVAEPGDMESAGRPLKGVGVAIAEDGEILVSGATVNALGSLRTGDLGRIDEQGRLVVTGRKSDVIITGGENVSPAEVEGVLLEHPGVSEAAVFARPHPLWGDAVTAWVVPVPEAAPSVAALRAHCLERLARFKVPKAFELVDELPRTDSGKVRRTELR
ncbi:MAG TPA: AMP-binding protein [Solirubrobacteraceae bacterium]|nr:AMP-binding protein [Solirubrobacteraceae bacterium]